MFTIGYYQFRTLGHINLSIFSNGGPARSRTPNCTKGDKTSPASIFVPKEKSAGLISGARPRRTYNRSHSETHGPVRKCPKGKRGPGRCNLTSRWSGRLRAARSAAAQRHVRCNGEPSEQFWRPTNVVRPCDTAVPHKRIHKFANRQFIRRILVFRTDDLGRYSARRFLSCPPRLPAYVRPFGLSHPIPKFEWANCHRNPRGDISIRRPFRIRKGPSLFCRPPIH